MACYICSRSTDGQTTKEAAVASDGELWVSRALKTITKLEKDTKHVTSHLSMSENYQKVHFKAREVLSELHKVGLLFGCIPLFF
jgi:DNA polymerase phi